MEWGKVVAGLGSSAGRAVDLAVTAGRRSGSAARRVPRQRLLRQDGHGRGSCWEHKVGVDVVERYAMDAHEVSPQEYPNCPSTISVSCVSLPQECSTWRSCVLSVMSFLAPQSSRQVVSVHVRGQRLPPSQDENGGGLFVEAAGIDRGAHQG